MKPADLSQLGFSALVACEDLPSNLPNLIETDSRKDLSGKWYWPIVGETFNGHDFIGEALEKGAIGFCYERGELIDSSLLDKASNFAVDNSLSALQSLARWWRQQHPNCKVIGITGSNGKTTAKEIIAHILKAQKPTLYSKGSFNNEIGLPLTLCQMTEHTQVAVLEMGARHTGDIRFLSNIAGQDVSILLNIGTAHLGEFGSAAALRETKQEILTQTPRATIAIVPEEDELSCKSARDHHDNVITFGYSPDANVAIQASSIKADGSCHLTFKLWQKETIEICVPFFHLALEPNIAAALACSLAMKLDLDAAIRTLTSFTGVARRFEIKQKGQLTIIDDTYNANPQSMLSGLQSIQKAYPQEKPVLILGDMLELGETSQIEHERIGAFVGKTLNACTLVAVGEQSKSFIDGAKKEGMPSDRLYHYTDQQTLINDIDNVVKHGNLLYAKASNGIRLYQVIDYLMHKT